jgi:hypothetical protein
LPDLPKLPKTGPPVKPPFTKPFVEDLGSDRGADLNWQNDPRPSFRGKGNQYNKGQSRGQSNSPKDYKTSWKSENEFKPVQN